MSTQWGPVIGASAPLSQPVQRSQRKSFLKRKQFIFAGGILALILAYLIYMGVLSAGMYYMTVSELLAQRETLGAEPVRIEGKVVADSVKEDPASKTLSFVVSDGQNSLPVVYRGVVPDSFQPDAEVVMEGTLTEGGSFEATSLLAKCASKYNPLKSG